MNFDDTLKNETFLFDVLTRLLTELVAFLITLSAV